MTTGHVALRFRDLIGQRKFCFDTFEVTAGPIHVNAANGFRSCFLRLKNGARFELVSSGRLVEGGSSRHPAPGYAHLAVATGSTAAVYRIAAAGHSTTDGPRWSGDGYDESTMPDPEGNFREISA